MGFTVGYRALVLVVGLMFAFEVFFIWFKKGLFGFVVLVWFLA